MDDSKDEEEKIRRKAFKDDAVRFKTAAFWKNQIEQRSQTRALQRATASKRNRPESDNDDEIQIIGGGPCKQSPMLNSPKRLRMTNTKNNALPTPISSGKKRMVSIEKQTKNEDSDDGLFVSEAKSQRDPFVSAHDRQKARTASRKAVRDELYSDKARIKLEPSPSTNNNQRVRAENRKAVQDNPPGDDICTVFVGQTHVPFSVRKNEGGIGECDFLSDLVVFTPEHGSHINLDEHVNINPRDFMPIADYLQYGEFTPRLVGSKSSPRLERVLLPEERDIAATNIAKIYLTGSKVQLAALQSLCVEKLKVLSPLNPKTLLIALMIVTKAAQYGCAEEKEVQEWLVDNVQQQFWTLVEREGATLARLMRTIPELWQHLSQKLAQNAELGFQEN